MGKHDLEAHRKRVTNHEYALRYRQRECKKCKHRSSKFGKHCHICGHDKFRVVKRLPRV